MSRHETCHNNKVICNQQLRHSNNFVFIKYFVYVKTYYKPISTVLAVTGICEGALACLTLISQVSNN